MRVVRKVRDGGRREKVEGNREKRTYQAEGVILYL